MTSSQVERIAVPALVLIGLVVVAELYAALMSKPAPRVITDLSSVGELEPVGPIGNVDPYVGQGRPGDVPGLGITLPVWFGWP